MGLNYWVRGPLDVPLPTYPHGKSLYTPYITWVFMGYFIPKNPKVEHNKYHGYIVRGTPNCPLIMYGIFAYIHEYYYPKYPDPSKVPILRTRTPAIQVPTPPLEGPRILRGKKKQPNAGKHTIHGSSFRHRQILKNKNLHFGYFSGKQPTNIFQMGGSTTN